MKYRIRQALTMMLSLFLLQGQQAIAEDVIARVLPQRYLKGIFWKIEKPGTPASYLLGTVHVDHPEIMALLDRFKPQFTASSLVCTEVLMNYESMAAEMRAMFFSDGRTLRKVINDEAFYRRLITAAVRKGLPEAALSSMKPWAVMYMLSTPGNSSMEVLDMRIYTNAMRQGKKVCGLETIEKHSNALNVFTLQDQLEMLRVTVDNLDQYDQMNTRILQVYLAADLVGMVEMIIKGPGMENKYLVGKFIQKLVIDRNQDMLHSMRPHLARGGGFFAVGAMHLTGEAGLLRLVEGLGYKLTRIY